MKHICKLGVGLLILGSVVGCSSEPGASEAGGLETSYATKAEALSQSSLEPRVDGMTLQLIDEKTGKLGLKIAPSQQRALAPKGVFSLQLDVKEAALSFNDTGKDPDQRANDGIFTGRVPVDLARLNAINNEMSKLEQRSVSQFAPGTREVVGTLKLPKLALDLEALKSGRVVNLLDLSVFGPLKTLGAVSTGQVNPQKSLIVSALPVIEDGGRTANPCAKASTNSPLKNWTFGHLMTEMAAGSGHTASEFVELWLKHWTSSQVVKDGLGNVIDDVSASAAQLNAMVITPWRARSGGGALDLSIAPFRLQAILYRPDLAKRSYVPSPENSAGELRFVFGLIEAKDVNNDGDALDAGDTCQPREMAVIFEYGVPLTQCQAQKDWANKWVQLSSLLQGTPAYSAQLAALTEAVVLAGSNPLKPNGNALNQLRTNEIDLTGIWQFREFHLESLGTLEQASTANNPREHQAAFSAGPLCPTPNDLNGSALLLSEITGNLAAIQGGTYFVPDESGGLPFKGGSSSYNFNTFWDHPALSSASELDARFKFSVNTCSGCHTGETATAFYHVRPTGPGSPPTLSNFLLSSPLTVTDNRGLSHTFNEQDNRKQALVDLANQTCKFVGGIPPFQLLRRRLNSSH